MEPTVEQILSLDSAASLAPAAVLPPARYEEECVWYFQCGRCAGHDTHAWNAHQGLEGAI